ncbi:DUF1214 domain-containing protein [Streptomyces mexicanus]
MSRPPTSPCPPASTPPQLRSTRSRPSPGASTSPASTGSWSTTRPTRPTPRSWTASPRWASRRARVWKAGRRRCSPRWTPALPRALRCCARSWPAPSPPATRSTAGPFTVVWARTGRSTPSAPSSPGSATEPTSTPTPSTPTPPPTPTAGPARRPHLRPALRRRADPAGAGLWSLTMMNDRQLFVDNPLGRYAIGDRSGMATHPDGSLDIYLQHQSPGPDRESNWLPAPEGSFNVFLRLYWPEQAALTRAWTPPPLRRTS